MSDDLIIIVNDGYVSVRSARLAFVGEHYTIIDYDHPQEDASYVKAKDGAWQRANVEVKPVEMIEPFQIESDRPDEVPPPPAKQKFEVCLQQYVERLAEMTIYAETAEEARDIALRDSSGLEWRDGDDAHDVECYAVNDANGNEAWER